MGVLYYPYLLVLFWVRDVVWGSIKLSKDIIIYWLNLVSVPLLLRTFFKPLKNEYHEGLVVFSIIMGMIVKAILLLAIASTTVIILAVLLLMILIVGLMPLFIMRMLVW